MAADILIYAFVAAGLIFWLRNILGTQHGDEPRRPNPFTSNPEDNLNQASTKQILKKIHAEVKQPSGGQVDPSTPGLTEGLEKNMVILTAAEPGLREIARSDRNFSVAAFLKGAQDAFIIIVEAFAASDRETLKGLLSEPVHETFSAELDRREKEGEKASVEIHAVRRMEITDARIEHRTALITVRFTADETNVVRDRDDRLIFGSPDHVGETTDIWTFSRDLRSRDHIWYLHETRDENAAETPFKTAPDSR